jgi:hypothetical protein
MDESYSTNLAHVFGAALPETSADYMHPGSIAMIFRGYRQSHLETMEAWHLAQKVIICGLSR